MSSACKAVRRFIWLGAMAAGAVAAGCDGSRAPVPQPPPQPTAVDEAAASPPTLGWRFAVGDRLAYIVEHAVDSRTTVPDGGGQAFTLSQKFDLDWEVAGIDDDGAATIQQRIRRVRLRARGMMGEGEFDSAKENSELAGPLGDLAKVYRAALDGEFRFRIDARGKIDDLRVPDAFRDKGVELGGDEEGPNSATGTIQRILTDAMIPLPDGQSSPGTQWTADQRLPMGPIGDVRNNLRYRWLGDKREYWGTPVVRIEVFADAVFERGADSQEPMTLASQEAQGYGLFDSVTGRLLSYWFEQKLEMSGEGSFTGATLRQDFFVRVDAVPSAAGGGLPPRDSPNANAADGPAN